MEPRFNELLYYKDVLGITIDFLQPSQNYKCMEQSLNITNLNLMKSSLLRAQSSNTNIKYTSYKE